MRSSESCCDGVDVVEERMKGNSVFITKKPKSQQPLASFVLRTPSNRPGQSQRPHSRPSKLPR